MHTHNGTSRLWWATHPLTLVIFWACVHFLAALVTGVIAHGLDFDQLTSRSITSRVANVMHNALMAPHTALIRSMPNQWLTQARVPIIPILLFGHSLMWGAVITGIALASRRRLRRR